MSNELKGLRVCHVFGSVRALKIGGWQKDHGATVFQVMIEDPKPYESYWRNKIDVVTHDFATSWYNKLKSKQVFSVFKAYLFLYFFYIKRLAEVVRKNNVQVIHAHRHTGAAVAFLARKLFGLRAKIIFDYHDPWSAEEKPDKGLLLKAALKNYFWLENYLVKNADLVVTQGEEQTNILINRHKISRKKFVFTWNTADPKLYKPNSVSRAKLRKKYGLDGKLAVLYLGTVINYFGIHLIPRAAKLLVKKNPNVVFVMMGVIRDKPYWDSIKKEIASNNLQKYFVEIYPKSKSEIPSLVGACDVGLITHTRGSYICEVAVPTKLFEYMASGLAVVCSNLKHITQFVVPYKAGLEFEANNPASLAKALEKLASDKQLAKKMGANSRKAVEERFNWDVEMTKLARAYKTVL